MIKVFGCSHSRIFKKIKINDYSINCEAISGATLSGLPKKISTLSVKNRIISYLKNNEPSFLILKFGQVDIDLKYYYRLVVKGESLEKHEYIQQLLLCYDKFISEILPYIDKSKVIIFGINPPALIDKEACFEYTSKIILENQKELYDLLKKSIKSIEERTSFSRDFNEKLNEMCISRGIKYTEVFNEFLNSNNIVSNTFTKNNDHHLKGIESDQSHFKETNNLFKKKLESIIF